MTKKEQIDYARYVLLHNAFYDFEVDALRGIETKGGHITGKIHNPHGLSPEVWRKASEGLTLVRPVDGHGKCNSFES